MVLETPHSVFKNRINIWVMFLGLALSETQVIYKFIDLGKNGNVAIFSLVFSLITTIFIGRQILEWLSNLQPIRNETLEIIEFLGIPLSVIVLNANIENHSSETIKVILMLLFVLQVAMIATQIAFFGSVTEDFAPISVIARFVRLVKMGIQIILLILHLDPLVYALISLLLQMVSTAIVCKKNTFQLILTEYHYFVGTICGLISTADFLVHVIFSTPYCFLGEGIAATCFLLSIIDLYPMVSIFELKYSSILKDKTTEKTEEERLAIFLLVRQCLLEQYRSIELSRNINILAFIESVEVVNHFNNINDQTYRQVNQRHLYEELTLSKDNFFKKYIDANDHVFKNTESITCLQLYVDSFLSIKHNSERALIKYYSFLEDQKGKLNMFESLRLQKLYHKITSQIKMDEQHMKHISFVSFNEKMKRLRQNMSTAFEKQITLIEQLQEVQQKGAFPEQKLIQRYEIKENIRKLIESSIQDPIYVNSNQFKFLVLLFGIGLEKRQLVLELKLKRLFFSSQAIQNYLNTDPEQLVIMKGFGRGQILKCNQKFKNHFKIGLEKGMKASISDLFPSNHQKNRHIELMNEASENSQKLNNTSHEDYQCLLVVEMEKGELQFKIIESFEIDTRIYYETQQGFNYVCRMKEAAQKQNLIRMTKKQISSLEAKGFQISTLTTQLCVQLDEEMTIFTIQLFKDETGESKSINQQKKQTIQRSILGNKLNEIDKKLMDQETAPYQRSNIIEIILVLCLIVFVTGSIVLVQDQLSTLEEVVTKDIWAVKKSTVVISKHMMLSQILKIVNATPTSFPNNMCQSNGISSMSDYILNSLKNQLFNNYAPLLDRVSSGQMNPEVIKHIQSQNYTTNGMDWGGIIPRMTYTQVIDTYKQLTIEDLKNKGYEVIDKVYELYTMPYYYNVIGLSSLQRIYEPIQQHIKSQFVYFTDFNDWVLVIMCSVVVFVVIILVLFRVYGNKSLMQYYDAISSLRQETLAHRMHEVKNIMETLKKSSRQLPTVDIDEDINKLMKKYAKNSRTESIQFNDAPNMKQSEQKMEKVDEEKQPLLGKTQKYIKQQTTYLLVRLLMYSRCYFLLMLMVLIGIITFANLFVVHQKDKLTAIQTFYTISEETSHLQQQYANLLAFNWLRTLSYQSQLPMQAYNYGLLDEAMTTFSQTNITTVIQQAYSRDFAHNILYGDVCWLFLNQTYCEGFHNGMFENGFSMLLPVTIKDQYDVNDFSTVYSDYYMHLCDMTTIFLQGVVPMTERIPQQGYIETTRQLDQKMPFLYALLAIQLLILIVLPVLYQWKNHGKIKKIRDEMFSLDSIDVLYRESALKPFFNQVYYT